MSIGLVTSKVRWWDRLFLWLGVWNSLREMSIKDQLKIFVPKEEQYYSTGEGELIPSIQEELNAKSKRRRNVKTR